MSNIQIAVSAADAAVTAPATLTSGMVGATVTFAFSGTAWQSLRKIAVFRAGSVRRDVEETDWSGSVCTIPWECLSEADERLLVGVYGMDEAGTVVIPTVYADCGWIWPGADPAGDPAADPTGPFYAGLLAEALEKAKASGAFDGPAGPQGDKGDPGDSYTVKGLYATLADLQAAHPTGSAGDAWFVGTAEDNVVYQWDVDQAAWVNVGALKGPQGDKGDNGDPGIVISATQPTAENHPVWINPEGEASPSGGTDLSLGVTSATVGQIAKITAVDDSGKPTAWESVELPNGLPTPTGSDVGKVLIAGEGGTAGWGNADSDIKLIYSNVLTKAVSSIIIDKGPNGHALSLSRWKVCLRIPPEFADYSTPIYMYCVDGDDKGFVVPEGNIATNDISARNVVIYESVSDHIVRGFFYKYGGEIAKTDCVYYVNGVNSTAINLHTYSADKPFPVGTFVEVYGK